MEKPIIECGLVYVGTIKVYVKKVVISKIFNTKTVLFTQIADLEVNMVTQRLKIKTTGGEVISLIINGRAEDVKQAIEKHL